MPATIATCFANLFPGRPPPPVPQSPRFPQIPAAVAKSIFLPTMGPVRFVRRIVALLLLAAWPALTSHSLLELIGVIHQSHEAHAAHHHDHHHHPDDPSHEHGPADHDFADGGYIAKSSNNSAPFRALPQTQTALWAIASTHQTELVAGAAFGPAPPGVAPPEFLQTWNFLHRTAIDARAPSSPS